MPRLSREQIDAVRTGARRLARRTAAIGYHSIVVPLLGRAETEHALDLACRLAAQRRAQVLLVAPIVADYALPLDAHFEAESRELRQRLARAEAIAKEHGVEAKSRTVRTRSRALGRELAEVAYDHRAELVVVGAPVESRRGLRHSYPPEIRSILRDAPCRVMIVSGRIARGAGDEEPVLRRLLVPLKLGPIGTEMLGTAMRLAKVDAAEIRVLHVVKVPLDQPLDSPVVDLEEQATAALEEAALSGERNGVAVVGEAIRGRSIGQAIIRVASDRDVDLIVLGSSPRWRREARFFSPSVEYVLRHAEQQVLVLAFPASDTLTA